MSYNFWKRKWGVPDAGVTGGVVTWSLSLDNIQYDTNLYTRADFLAAMQAAFDRWESVADIDFQFMEGDADIDVGMEDLGGPGGVVGRAQYWIMGGDNDGDGIDQISRAYVKMDTNEQWSPYGEGAGVNWYAVALHEIAHTFGLGHVNDGNEIMNSYLWATDLGPGDIAGIQHIYGTGDPHFPTSGTMGRDVVDLTGGPAAAAFNAMRGDDVITGSGNNDTIYGGQGNDTVNGAAGNDTLADTLGNNTLNGGIGHDVITGGIGQTTANGDGGSDIIIGGIGNDILSGGSGNDTIRGDLAGSFFFGDDILRAGTGTDFLEGGEGADTFEFNRGDGVNHIASLNIDPNDPSATSVTGADFESGIDHVNLTDFGYGNTTQVFDNIENVGGHAVFSDQGTQIHFYGLLESDLIGGDFLI